MRRDLRRCHKILNGFGKPASRSLSQGCIERATIFVMILLPKQRWLLQKLLLLMLPVVLSTQFWERDVRTKLSQARCNLSVRLFSFIIFLRSSYGLYFTFHYQEEFF